MADVVDLIKAQHRQVEELLQQAEQSEPDAMVALLRQVAELLKPHSEAEESFVYPAIRDYDSSEADEVKDGTAEHHHVEQLLNELLSEDPRTPGYDGKVAAMIGELRHHVEEEEQDLLPVLTGKASDEEREELGARFSEVTGFTIEQAPRASRSSSGGSADSARKARADDEGGVTREELSRALDER